MRVASIVHLDFLDAHGGYYTATIYIHLQYFFVIYFNSRKTLFPVASCSKEQISCTFEVLELLLLVWCCCCRRECKEGAQVATTVIAGGSLRVTFMPS